jgi:hypothetical protein
MRQEKVDSAVKVLSDAQKKTWKEVTGEPFEMKLGRP